MTKFQKMN